MGDGAWWRVLASMALAYAWNSPASAADQVRHRCAVVPDDSGRLACYDAEFGRPEPAATPPAEPRLIPQGDAAATTAVAGAAVEGTGAAAGTGAVAAVGAEADFGLSKWTKRSLDPEAAKALPQRITARVRRVERQRDGRFVVTLANGQVWLQSETMSRARVAVDDEVTIREASLGSFLLLTVGDVATRVRRVK